MTKVAEKTETENKELATTSFNTNAYPALSEQAVYGIKEAMDANLGGQSIDPRKLFSTIKMPSGGVTFWEIPAVEGENINVKEFTGIIMSIGLERARYEGKYGSGNKIPVCTSSDGIIGHGESGGECVNCQYNQFDTHPEHKGRKACSETRPIYFIMKDTGDFEAEEWPMILRITAGSFGPLDDYRIKLAKSRIMIHTIETKFTLMKTKNQGDIDYSQLVMTRGERISDEATKELVKKYRTGISPFITPQLQQTTAA